MLEWEEVQRENGDFTGHNVLEKVNRHGREAREELLLARQNMGTYSSSGSDHTFRRNQQVWGGNLLYSVMGEGVLCTVEEPDADR